MKRFFSIGSVVKLKNVSQRVMIVGHVQREVGTERIWDYAAVPFPEGVLEHDKFILFDHDSIDKLYFVGLQDTESMTYMQNVFEVVNREELEKLRAEAKDKEEAEKEE